MIFQEYLWNDRSLGLFNWRTVTPLTPNNFNMEMIALHELGHAHLLEHVNQTDDIMFWQRTPVTEVMTVPSNLNIEGAKHIINLSTKRGAEQSDVSARCPAPMIKVVTSACSDLTKNDDVQREGKPVINGYPNPTLYDFFVDIPHYLNTSINIDLYNAIGELVGQQKNVVTDKLKIPMQHLSSGLYTLKVSFNNQFSTFKIVKK